MSGAVAGARLGVSRPRLLEREHELAMLERAIQDTLASSSGIVVVEGPAGIGKSRLVAAARERAAEAGVSVLSARGSELERDFPFGVVRQLFEPRLAVDQARARLLSGAAGASAAVFGVPRKEPTDGDGAAEWSFAALHGLYWLTLELSAEAPLLVAIDDLHWCDRSSLRFLAYLARRLEGAPVLVVGSLRPSEPGADEALLRELASDPRAQVLVLRPLSAGAAAEVVRERLGEAAEPAFAEACHASTQGNPLLLGELLKALQAERVPPDAAHLDVVAELGPRAASRAVLLRLARLSPSAVSLARALAVLGDGAELPVVGGLAGLDGEAVGAASRELIRAEILRPEPPLGFVHPLVQAAVYRDLAPGERELSHERAARLLLGHDAPAEQVAAHVIELPRGGEEWVVDVLREAARAAFAKGAPDAAIASLRRALAEAPPPELRTTLLFELGQAQALMSLPDSVEALRGAYESAHDPELRGLAADWLACSLVFLEAADEAAEIWRRTSLELPPELEDLSRQLEAGEFMSLFFGSDHEDAARLERLRSNRTIDTDRGPGAKMLAAIAAWEWASSAGPVDRVVALARAALSDDTLLGWDAGELVIGAILPLALADLDEAMARWDAVRGEAHRTGFVYTLLAVELWGGYTRHLRGELAEAETELRAALETAAHWGVPMQEASARSILAEILVDSGAVAKARALLDGAANGAQGSDTAMLVERAKTRVLLAEGRAQEALERADVLEGLAVWRRHPRLVPWRSLKAQALDRLDRQDEAVALAAAELEVAREWGSPGTVGRSLRVLGMVERQDGLDHLEEACTVLEEAPARLERAKALAALGGALRRARKPTEARDPLRKALELAEICGATTLVESTRAEIYATGARPRTTALSGVGSLTPSERRVADLAAEGFSNRDIAQMLYVTPKTVEVHLSSAYRKLGVSSRRELPVALGGNGVSAAQKRERRDSNPRPPA
jgi:DNA-binding CsgD family transcriptional regulator